jgi:hypothetical protein
MPRSQSLPLPRPQLRLALPDPDLTTTIPSLATAEWDELLRLAAELLLEAAGLAEEGSDDDEH